MKPIIEIKNLSAGYDGRTVLHDVNLNVYERDFLGIIGPNGGGKTTLIKCILGLLPLTGGEECIFQHGPLGRKGFPTPNFHLAICRNTAPSTVNSRFRWKKLSCQD